MFQTEVVEKTKKKLWSIIFFLSWKPCHLWADAEKYCEARQATVDSLAHIHCMLHTYSYKQTLRIGRLILIAFPLQQRSHKFNSMLCLYIHCLLVIFWCFSKATYPQKMAEMLVVEHILQFEKPCPKRFTAIIVAYWRYITACSGCSISIHDDLIQDYMNMAQQ